jgi:hypothetical protein
MKHFRMIISLLTALCLLFGAVGIVFAADEPDPEDPYVTEEDGCYLLGDINLDGKTSAADARTALRNAVDLEELSEEEALRADLNKDGIVTAADARLILRLAVELDPLPDHTPVEIEAKEPTCTEDGVTAGVTCKVCKRTLSGGEAIPALGHDLVETEEKPASWTKNYVEPGKKCQRCDYEEAGKEHEHSSKLYLTVEDANAEAAKAGIDKLIKAEADVDKATITILADGLWENIELTEGYFDGFIGALKKAAKHFLTRDDVVVFDGQTVLKDGRVQNTALKKMLFSVGAGFFYKIANLGEDGIYGVYPVKVNDEEIELTVRLEGSEQNVAKIRSFADTIAEHISAEISEEGELIIDVIAPDQLRNYLTDKLNGRDFNDMNIGAGLAYLATLGVENVFGSQTSAVNKLAGFICKMNPFVNKVLTKTDVKVGLANGESVALLNGKAFKPATEDYKGMMVAAVGMASDDLRALTVGDFANEGGVYTIPLHLTVDLSANEALASGVIYETVTVRLHLFD